jgi:hypothetical protein
MVEIPERKTKQDWACFLEQIAGQYNSAKKITLVMDNLNTHGPGSFMKHFNRTRQGQYGIDSSLCIPRSMEVG